MPDKAGLTTRQFLASVCAGLTGPLWVRTAAAQDPSPSHMPNSSVLSPASLRIGASTIDVAFSPGDLDLSRDRILAWVSKAARAVALYYGQFPVTRAQVRVHPAEDRDGVFHGTTYGGDPPFTRISVGQHTTQAALDDDWMMTHELVHMAFPNVSHDHHWIEEGIATYVEPVARVQTGELTPARIWGDMVRDMPQGEPEAGDEGLDRTHTWGRTYWGGALFCLAADVQIRQASKNRAGLQTALRAIVAAGGTIQNDWPIEKAFTIGDQGSGTQVLTDLYEKMKNTPVHVDLAALWREMGIESRDGKISFYDHAPFAAIRRAITTPRKA